MCDIIRIALMYSTNQIRFRHNDMHLKVMFPWGPTVVIEKQNGEPTSIEELPKICTAIYKQFEIDPEEAIWILAERKKDGKDRQWDQLSHASLKRIFLDLEGGIYAKADLKKLEEPIEDLVRERLGDPKALMRREREIGRKWQKHQPLVSALLSSVMIAGILGYWMWNMQSELQHIKEASANPEWLLKINMLQNKAMEQQEQTKRLEAMLEEIKSTLKAQAKSSPSSPFNMAESAPSLPQPAQEEPALAREKELAAIRELLSKQETAPFWR